MSKRLRRPFARAVRMVTASLDDVAEGMGRGASTLYAYLSGGRRVTPGAARALAAYLRKRARDFNEAAASLESAAAHEEREEQ